VPGADHGGEFTRLRELRASHPEAVADAAARRTRRELIGADSGMLIIAADHPARGALGVQGRPDAMADRYELLRRLVAALARPGVDGVLGTADILEDLLLLGALEDKIVIASMNRGGLQGSAFELDDRFTGYDAETIEDMGFSCGKMLVRIDLSDPGTVATLETSGAAVTQLARRRLVAMLEPFWSSRAGGRVVNDATADGVIRSVAVASGLGSTSAYTWLKLPVVPEMERVMAATTLPTMLLGGDPSKRPDETYASWRDALALPGVRGLVVGRTLLYPPDDEVTAAVDIAASLVHTTEGIVHS
jgi:hypothetical protein